MKRRRSGRAPRIPRQPEQAPGEIDRLYGLEPVFEPGGDPDGHITESEPVSVRCPYCDEAVYTRVDLSAGETSYVEDCQVCCQPMELLIQRTEEGALAAVMARRMD
jgi:hypothetical protein